MKLDFLLILCNYYLNIFCAEMDQEWMHLSQTDKRYMHGVSQFITDAKAHAGNGNLKRPDFREGKSTESKCIMTVVDHIT